MSRARRAHTTVTVALLVVLSTLAACTADDDAPGPAATIGPATAAVPAPGTRRVRCAVTAAQGPVILALDIPENYATSRNDPCRWRIPISERDERDLPIADTIVTVYATDDQTLQPSYDELLPSTDDGSGDEAVYDLELRTDVPVFGDTAGDRLSYGFAGDGVGSCVRTALAGGVVLRWSFPPDDGETDAAVEVALASAGIVETGGR